MKRFLQVVITGFVIYVSASQLVAQQPSRLERDSASTILPKRAPADSKQGAAVAAGGCPVGEIPDCNGNCAPLIWLGDTFCDNGAADWPPGSETAIFLNCDSLNCDAGDCDPELCNPSVCGNGVIEPGETCDDGNTTAGDGCNAACQIEGGVSTYSVHHMIGEELASGQRQCFRLADPNFPGEPDDIVAFDGLSEDLATDINGVAISVIESETNNPDGTISVSIVTSAPSLTDMFPGGFVSPDTSQPLTGACWFIGNDDHLDRNPPLTVQFAELTFTSDGWPLVGPADVTGFIATAPWDGFFGVWVPGAAGQFTNGVRLDLVYGPGDAGDCPGTGDCCADNGTPGCADSSCCEAVCAVDPYCCGNDPVLGGVWDDICVDRVATFCPGVPSCPNACPGTGACCDVHPESGCSDAACCSTVCDADPFCCGDDPDFGGSWDEICVEEAAVFCGICTTGACCWDSACETPGTCEAPVLCGAGCECLEVAEGGSGCTASVECADAVSCPNGTPDCPVGQQCYINSCCEGPVCFSDCAFAGAAASGVESSTGRSSRATRVGAGVASRGSVITCTDSTDVFCTAFGGVYKGDASLCSDVDVCAADCPQWATIDLTVLAATEYPCDATLPRLGNNILRFEFDADVVAPLSGEIEINEILGPGSFGQDISASFGISVVGGNVLTITEPGTVFASNTWYAIRNVGNWCEAANFEVDYGVAYGDADGLGGTGFNDLQAVFNVIPPNPLPPNSLPDSSRFDVDTLGGVGFNDLQAVFNNIPGPGDPVLGPKPSPPGCPP